MSVRNEFHLSSTPNFETWRVESRPVNRSQSQYAQYDAITASMDYLDLCGLPALDLATARISAAKRLRADASRDGIDDFKLLFQVSGGTNLVQDERATKLRAGGVAILDVTRPIHTAICDEEPGRVIGLHLPRRALVSHLGFEPQGGLCWAGESTLPARLLSSLVGDAIADGDAVAEPAQEFVRLAIYNLVGALFGATELPQHFSQGDRLFLRLSNIVRREFANPDVGAVEIAAEAGISVRYLQKLFALRGTTFGAFLKSVRLQQAASLLYRRTEAGSKMPLVEIAWACGYRDYAHFARDFRTRFGRTPGLFDARAAKSR